MLDAISRTDVDSLYMPPKVRELLARQEAGFMIQKTVPEEV
jgi:hypothetical protein